MSEVLFQKAKDEAFYLLSFRDRSQGELKKRLLHKEYPEEIISRVISRLTKLNYLNDYRFAQKWVKNRVCHKPRGRYLLIHELRSKGIAPETIERVLDELLSTDKESEMASLLAEKWLQQKGERTADKWIKLKNYLQNKGFSIQIINQLLYNYRIDDQK